MTVLSAAIGNVLPNLLPRKYTHYASAVRAYMLCVVVLCVCVIWNQNMALFGHTPLHTHIHINHTSPQLLFLYFGIKLLVEARGMEGDGPSDELEEVEAELIHKKEGACVTQCLHDIIYVCICMYMYVYIYKYHQPMKPKQNAQIQAPATPPPPAAAAAAGGS